MFGFIIGIIIGAFVGWNLSQPEWVKNIQDKLKSHFNK